jgi:chromate transporter
MSLLQLAFTFFYIGLFTIGGGQVAITLMQQAIVSAGLISQEQFYNMIAISESTPGPIGINMATYIGYELYGVPGALIVTGAQVLPSIIIILIIARFLKSFKDNPFVKGSLAFLRPVTTGLILVPVIQVIMFTLINPPESLSALTSLETWKTLCNPIPIVGYAVFAFLLFKVKAHPILVIILGAIFGMIFL